MTRMSSLLTTHATTEVNANGHSRLKRNLTHLLLEHILGTCRGAVEGAAVDTATLEPTLPA